MLSFNLTLVKICIFLLCLTLAYSADEVEETNTAETITTSTAVAPIVEPLDAAKCNKKRTQCCGQLYLGIDDDLTKCFTLHQSKIPKEDEKDPAKLLQFISCFIECQYKQRKYIGKGDNVNMKMVKSDAEKLFHDRPKEKDFHIEMFEFCRKDASTTYTMVKTNPGGKVILRDACKPYFTFVYLCNAEYHKKHRCPYFRWAAKRNTDAGQQCADDKEKCYELDGISSY